jgi:hypothetical protein
MWIGGDPVVIGPHPLRERLIGDWAEWPGRTCGYRFVETRDGVVEFGLVLDASAKATVWWHVGGMRWAGDVLRFELEVGFDGRDVPVGGSRLRYALWVSDIDRVLAVEQTRPDLDAPRVGFWRRME